MRNGCHRARIRHPHRAERGSVMVIVLWVCLGLVTLTVYFAGNMSAELRAADNRVAEIAARQAVAGGTRYAAYVLSQYGTNGAVPHPDDYRHEDLPVGDASFWFIGRDNDQPPTHQPVFGLVDEASKINLRTANRQMLEALPGMTPEFVDAILMWRSRSTELGSNDNTYARLDPPRMNKGSTFETVDELRLVYGATLDILFGEDTNRNGALDDNENDSDESAPRDNGDGLIDPGVLEYLTVYSREPTTRARGGQRVNIATQQGRQAFRQRLASLTSQARAAAVENLLGNAQLTSVAEYMVRGRFTDEEWSRVRDEVKATTATSVQGLINVNTASETVLACIPGIGLDNAAALVAYRASNPDVRTSSFIWLKQILRDADIIRAGRYITDRSYQFTADVAAVGHHGRGYCREKTVYDMSRGTPRIIFHQDFTAYGWALGTDVRQLLKDRRENRS